MKFEDIFEQPGLYKADSFAEGVAFEVKENDISHENELFIVTYRNSGDILPRREPQVVYGGLFKKDYERVWNRKELFSKHKV